jgi:hypothetical protein
MRTVTAFSSAHEAASTCLHALVYAAATSYRATAEKMVEISAGPVNEFTQDRRWSISSLGQVTIASAEEWACFRLLTEKWRKERGITSSAAKMVICPSYQRIIGMGDKVVPLILRQMQDEGDDPDHWFWALEMITNADPVPVEAYGDTVRMAQAWFSWAEGRYAW